MKLLEKFTPFNHNRNFIIFNVIALFFLSNFLFSDWNCRWDMSRSKRFALTESTEKILKSLPEKLYIDAYYSSDIPGEYKARLDLAKEMIREIASVNKSKVELRFFDPDSNETDRKKATEFGIDPQTLQKSERGSATLKQAYFGVVLTLGEKTEVLPVAFFAEQMEYQILSSLKKMVKKNSSSGVGILKAPGSFSAPPPGQGSGKDTYGIFITQAYVPENGNVLDVNINEEKVPDEVVTLIWSGAPSLTDIGKYYLDQFLMRGGNLVIFAKTMDFSLDQRNRQYGMMMGMGGEENMARTSPESHNLQEFTKNYGFEVKSDLVLEPEYAMPMGPLVQVEPGVIGRYHYPLWIIVNKKNGGLSKESPLTIDTDALLLPWVSSIEINPDKQKEAKFVKILESTPNASKKGDFLNIGENSVATSELTPNGSPILLGLHIEGALNSAFTQDSIPKLEKKENFISKTVIGKKNNIVVLGTPYLVSDILATREFRETFQETNIPFVMNLLDSMSGDTDLLAARGRKGTIMNLHPFSKTTQIFFSFFNVLAVPIFLALFAFSRLKRRNNVRASE
ncbi:MAG: GldG family protein [Leptospiraceae bacterium]|nr:GldG family protein [Leptospiraceae bacterium]MCK6380004.1 GldG family protein [Leptospiraceae bacterium]NUM40153.1 GldG family protein [Leptospiraceae bacterium]